MIERRRQGLGKPNLIYVKNFIEGNFLKCPNDTSVSVQSTVHDVSKGHGNKTDKNYTDLSETDPFLSDVAAGTESEGKDDRTRYQEYFLRQFAFDSLVASCPDDEDMLREILELLVDTVCSKRRFIRIAGDDKPAEVVKAQLMKLNSDHLRFVLMCLKENTTLVRNMRQYLLAALYNSTISKPDKEFGPGVSLGLFCWEVMDHFRAETRRDITETPDRTDPANPHHGPASLQKSSFQGAGR